MNIVQNRQLKLPNIPSGKGNRLLVFPAGGPDTGFIPEYELVFIGKDVDVDYHKEINSSVFMDWFKTRSSPH